MEKVRLGDVCTINGGYAFKSDQFSTEGVPVIRIGNITKEGLIIDEDVCYDEKFWNENDSYRIAENDILIAMSGATVGKSCINNTERKLLLNQRVAAINCDNNINLKYIFYSIDSEKFSKYIMTNSIGCAQPNISLKQIANFEISAVCQEEQKRIADELDKITDLINKRKEQLSKMDELVKARFVELFGDPILNQKGFPVYRMDEVVEFQGGSQPDKKYFEYEPTENNIRFIQIRDYKTDKYITYIPKSMAKRFCTADDIMIGRYGPPIFQILQGIEGSFNVALMKATPKMGNKEFIRQFLKQDCLLEYLEGLSKRTAGQDGIQMDKLKAYPFPMPPIELQEEFEQFIKQTDKSKMEVKKSLEKLELLKKALMQKYFG